MPTNKPLAKIYHFDSFGKRQEKYEHLNEQSLSHVPWTELELKEPYYFFVPKDFAEKEKYDEGFSVSELFPINGSGVKTDRDTLYIDDDRGRLEKRINKLLSQDYDNSFIQEYNVNNSGSYKILEKINGKYFQEEKMQKIVYRPFDIRWIYYDENLISRAGYKVMQHIVNRDNLSLLFKRQCKFEFSYTLVSDIICESCTFESAYANNSIFPLYLYSESGNLETGETQVVKTPNFNMEIISNIEKELDMRFLHSQEGQDGFIPEDILDYIYAVLHSKTYRETYKEFLKIDFPKIPYSKDKENFFELVKLGRELRSFHLLENPKVWEFITSYPIVGDNLVEKIVWKDEKVYINEIQYFDGIAKEVFEFQIGGYKPAEKYLKDRKGRNLTSEEFENYQKMIVALSETRRIMGEIDEVFKI